MTEAEWLVCNDPQRMLDHHQWVDGPWPNPLTSKRKLRLWVEACRSAAERGRPGYFHFSPATGRLKQRVETWASGLWCDVVPPALRAALAREIFGNPFRPPTVVPSSLPRDVIRIAEAAAVPAANRCLIPGALQVLADELTEAGCTDAALLGHLRGILPDNDPTPWEHRERADGGVAALEREMAARLSPAVHVRGCWAIDLILGKE
jgi:hypothetical protein